MKKSELEKIIKKEIKNVMQEGIFSKFLRRKIKKKAPKSTEVMTSYQHLADAVFKAELVPLKDTKKVKNVLDYTKKMLPQLRVSAGKVGEVGRIKIDKETMLKYHGIQNGKNSEVPEFLNNWPDNYFGAEEDLEQLIFRVSLKATK
jgi:hypothetical protein